MKSYDGAAPWRDLLPLSYAWIEQVALQKTEQLQAGAHHLVMVRGGEAGDGEFILDGKGLPQDLKQKITQAAKAVGYHSGCGMTTVICDETPFTLVPQNTLDVSLVQRGRQAGLDTANYMRERRLSHLVICAGSELSSLGIWEGLSQGYYSLETFKGERGKKNPFPPKVSLWDASVSSDEIVAAKAMAKALTLARMLGDAPPNWLNPPRLAAIASDLGKELGVNCQIKGRKDLEALGMGAFLSVAQGSAVEPQLIVLEIKGQKSDKKVALVGKGLTFDAGGVCLKPAANMGEMKYDMCGGAAVLAAAYYLGKVRPPVDVICIVGAVENLIGEKATRPGDVVKTMNGKTVEVLNTDAEGRLVLADCLHYAREQWKPDLLVDVATLTGAVLMALGSCGSALLSNNQQAADYVLDVARKVGEPLWQLPLWPELAKEMKSDLADLKNIPNANVKAGTVTAGCFLREFVGDSKWVHLDIAGTAWNCRATGFPGAGGSGFGVKTLAHICTAFSSFGKS